MPAGVLRLGSGAQELEGEIPSLPDPVAQCLGIPPAVHGRPDSPALPSVQSGTRRGHARPEFQLTALRQESLIKAKT